MASSVLSRRMPPRYSIPCAQLSSSRGFLHTQVVAAYSNFVYRATSARLVPSNFRQACGSREPSPALAAHSHFWFYVPNQIQTGVSRVLQVQLPFPIRELHVVHVRIVPKEMVGRAVTSISVVDQRGKNRIHFFPATNTRSPIMNVRPVRCFGQCDPPRSQRVSVWQSPGLPSSNRCGEHSPSEPPLEVPFRSSDFSTFEVVGISVRRLAKKTRSTKKSEVEHQCRSCR